MHRVASFVFWMTLALFLLVLIFASYVGVYLTYVAIPVIVLSGLIMRFTKPKVHKAPPPVVRKEPSSAGKFFQELKAFVSEEAADAKAMIKDEADTLEKFRLERSAQKPVSSTDKKTGKQFDR